MSWGSKFALSPIDFAQCSAACECCHPSIRLSCLSAPFELIDPERNSVESLDSVELARYTCIKQLNWRPPFSDRKVKEAERNFKLAALYFYSTNWHVEPHIVAAIVAPQILSILCTVYMM